jgi:F-type H+-transporting ATPase subunit gamma
MINDLENMKINIGWRKTLPASSLSSYQQSYLMTQKWLHQFEKNEFNHFFILFNQIGAGSRQQFSEFSLLPYEVSHPLSAIGHQNSVWPEPIIETDPKGIYRQIIQHAIASGFYKILLLSAASEHSARFQLMQEAKDNAENIVEDLTQVINAERKRKITQEMQELAAGAGLLDNQ